MDKIKAMIEEIINIKDEIKCIYEEWEDYGAIPGCDCGCGGDTFDWNRQDEEYKRADELKERIQKMYGDIELMIKQKGETIMDIKIQGNKPKYMTDGACGADLISNEDELIVIMPGKHRIIKTGTSIELPYGYEAQVRPRSGLAFRDGIIPALGTIDFDYRGEIGICLFNFGDAPFAINKGDRIGQLVINKVEIAKFIEGDLSSTDRGNNGFGSTGV